MRLIDKLWLLSLLVAVIFFVASQLSGEVDGPFQVVDGDTLKKDDTYYRAYYIDAPELGKQKPWVLAELPDAECLSSVAEKAKLFAYGVAKVKLMGKQDKYGRELSHFLLPDGSSAELEMVKRGYARCYFREPRDGISQQCLELEKKASSSSLGMWSCG